MPPKRRAVPSIETVLGQRVEVYRLGERVGYGYVCTRPNGEMHVAEIFDEENNVLPPDVYNLQFLDEEPRLWVVARRVQ